ncbi:MAG: hypothetical protein D6773_02490 [Alphaproteobacteria bacterium]|nr:MAG: hypothetical protein D6773_02490 [Alphaproteobacteria bacterium]
MYGLLAAGLGLLAAILVLIWLKDKLRSPRLARLVHSGLVARLALAGVAFLVLGVLLMLAELLSG